MTRHNREPVERRAERLQMLDGLHPHQRVAEEWSDLQSEAERLQTLDDAIAGQLNCGPVPSGLADRLLQAAQRERNQDEKKQGETAAGDTAAGETAQHPPARHALQIPESATPETANQETDESSDVATVRPPHSRQSATGGIKRGRSNRRSHLRWWVAAGAGMFLLAVTSFGIGMLIWPQADPPVSRQSVCHDAMKWVRELEVGRWKTDPQSQLGDYPMGPDILPSPQRWMTLETDFDDQTVVYDLTPPGQRRVLQFTIRSSREFDLATFLPLTPIYQTAQFCISACYQDGRLHVLFVEGNAERYRQMIEKRLGIM